MKEKKKKKVLQRVWIFNTENDQETGYLTALLARTLTLGRGMNPVWLARAQTPIGSTECGS